MPDPVLLPSKQHTVLNLIFKFVVITLSQQLIFSVLFPLHHINLCFEMGTVLKPNQILILIQEAYNDHTDLEQ